MPFQLTPALMRNVSAWETLPARPARYGAWPELHPALRAALENQGIAQLYAHQSAAIAAALRGENVVIATGTASGKTVCYNAPILDAWLRDPAACALYLFPTKALAQDQTHELQTLLASFSVRAAFSRDPTEVLATYDGDTAAAARTRARRHARLLLTNPDMLHTGLLPHHTQWADFWANLRYVVIDELHVYRGVFGSHCANVLRRLRRICAFYGSAPRFIATSATIANPRELAETLLEAPATLIDDDAAPRAEKHIILYNPPLTDAALGLRRSYLLEAQSLTSALLAAEIQTVVFARTRNATEILLGYVRDAAQAQDHHPQTIRGYRGGYLPTERRAIEQGLRAGNVRAVIATNALELGIDIGQLGAVVIAGYPGTLASLWQQGGRAGRRTESSVVVLIASAAPLDQFLMAHPRFIFERSPEHARLNPNNLALVADHARCAVFELPFNQGETFGSFGPVDDLLTLLQAQGEVHAAHAHYQWVGSAYPAAAISLRAAGADRVLIQQTVQGRPQLIGEVERTMAPVRVHEGAIYLHEGVAYRVLRLDWDNGVAEVEPASVDYFTEASTAVETEVVQVFEEEKLDPDDTETTDFTDKTIKKSVSSISSVQSVYKALAAAWGELLITSQAVSYRQIKRYTHEIVGQGVITLPPREFQTTGCWLWFPPEVVRELTHAGILLGPNNYGPNWPAQRNAARARDQFRCAQCGLPETDREHDVHHHQPFRSFGYIPGVNENYLVANDLSNLVTLCRTCHARVEAGRGTQTALGGLAHALSHLAPLYLMCDPRDLGVLAENRSPLTNAPTITFYDLIPEGLGFAQQLYALRPALLRAARDLIRACPCRNGCPACVGPVGVEETDVKMKTLQLAEWLGEK